MKQRIIKNRLLFITILYFNISCSIYTSGNIEYNPTSLSCGSFKCPPYCKIQHKHCKGEKELCVNGLKFNNLTLNISGRISSKNKQNKSTVVDTTK